MDAKQTNTDPKKTQNTIRGSCSQDQVTGPSGCYPGVLTCGGHLGLWAAWTLGAATVQIWADLVTLLSYPLRHKIRTEWQRLQMAMRAIPWGIAWTELASGTDTGDLTRTRHPGQGLAYLVVDTNAQGTGKDLKLKIKFRTPCHISSDQGHALQPLMFNRGQRDMLLRVAVRPRIGTDY